MKISAPKLFSSKAEAVGILLFLLLAVAPLLLGIVYALGYSFGFLGLISEGVTLTYWERALSDTELWISLLFTCYIALVTISLTILGALVLTIFLRKPFRKGLSGFALYVPLAFPAIVVAFLVFQLASQSGLFARIACGAGIISETSGFPELVNDPFGAGIIAAHTFMALPFFTLYFMNVYRQEQISSLVGVAETLGASPLQQVRRIIAPVLLRRAFPTITLYTIFVMGSYEIPLILGRQSPQMISVLAIRKLRRFSLSTIPEAYITAIVFIMVITLLLLLVFRMKTFSYDIDE
ncbi:MAG: ABC transporter permease subunit [Balneolaceae bacterium]|nr:ABC transporter permease subunit [Balneolaceae bacterium]